MVAETGRRGPDGFATPIALLVFNRPETTARVFAEVARMRPSTLLIAADGPRAGHPSDAQACAAVREIVTRVDWPCDVRTRFSPENLGCRRAVSSGLDWIFAEVEEAIILEDDCLPHPSFFPFCSELLERFRHDERVALISGANFQPPSAPMAHSYYFSRYTHIWGWASWRRTWQTYDVSMRRWPEVRDSGLLQRMFPRPADARYWTDIFTAVYAGRVDTWDYQLLLTCWIRNALAILPSVNLVSNIGHGVGATNTTAESPLAAMPVQAMTFPLRHPPTVARNAEADELSQRRLFVRPGLAQRARATVARLLRA